MKRIVVLSIVAAVLAVPAFSFAAGGPPNPPRPPRPSIEPVKVWPAPLFQIIAGKLGLGWSGDCIRVVGGC